VFWCIGYLFSGVVVGIDMATAFSGKAISGDLWQMKKRYSCWPFDFVGSKNGFYHRQINSTLKPFLLLTKSMQILPI
jgi:hypothetical protein